MVCLSGVEYHFVYFRDLEFRLGEQFFGQAGFEEAGVSFMMSALLSFSTSSNTRSTGDSLSGYTSMCPPVISGTPSCTCYDIPRPLPDGDEPLPIGLLSRNSEGLIVDHDGTPCVPGDSGELCILSSTLTRGYWNKPQLNDKAFLLKEGFGPFPTVYFRTGDRVQQGPDGYLRFLGRMDRMVKTRGHRVELDEVEAALVGHDDAVEVAAFVVPDEHSSQSIIAAVTLRDGAVADREALMRHVRKKLPPYAVPRDLLIVDALPHTSSGKVDRRQLTENYKPDR